LRRLPGIGIYTARALLVFAFKKDVGVVDTNIRKIIQKEFNAQNCSEKEIQQIADDIVPKGKSWEWHQALMDYGAANYTEKKTKKKNSIPFRESKRFIRGKILDRLRDKKEKEEITIQIMKEVFQRNKDETKTIIRDLIKEGLIENYKGYLRLPL
jgi:A/G-specific adenine glycosylase